MVDEMSRNLVALWVLTLAYRPFISGTDIDGAAMVYYVDRKHRLIFAITIKGNLNLCASIVSASTQSPRLTLISGCGVISGSALFLRDFGY